MAWLGEEKDPKTKEVFPVVRWKKGLKDEKEVMEFIKQKQLAFPIAIHFRTASIGGKRAGLCHPFPMVSGVPTTLEGAAPNVLFHNGHLQKWEDWMMKLGLPSTERWPEGPFSDSRGLAWAAYLKGENVIPWLMEGSRVLVFSADPYEPEGEEYVRGLDHFSLFGNWIKREGWRQSIDTVQRMRSRNHGWQWADRDTEIEDLPTTSTPPSKSPLLAPVAAPSGEATQIVKNIWQLKELKDLMENMRKEQAHAQLAAGN